MSVHQTPAGGYRVMWRTPAHGARCKPGCAKAMHQCSRTFDGIRDAERFDAKMLTATAAMREAGATVGVLPARPASTVRTFRVMALATIAEKVKRGKWSTDTGKLRKSSLNKLGSWADQPITSASLDLSGAQTIISGIKFPDSPIALVKATCDYAVREGDITAHAMSALEADRSRVPDARRDFILATDAQLAIVCKVLDDWRAGLGLMILLMRWCGLRTGEALGVADSDFAEDYSALTVRRQVNSDGKVTTLKGKKSDGHRTVPVPVRIREMIAAHVATLNGRERLFLGPRGGQVNRDDFGRECRAGARAAGLPEEWVPYQCRHHYASDLISRRVPLDRVAKMLGHASTTVTYRTYSHLMPGELDDICAVLDAA